MAHRRFQLHRVEDVTGVSGTGIVAEGVEFTGGVVALRGMAAVEAVHGHSGKTRIFWLDPN